jgi:flagellar biosynthesis GTPase FlhF
MSTTTYGTALQGASPDSADRNGGAPHDAHAGEDMRPLAPRPASAAAHDGTTRVYRGRSVDELVGKIQSELGADAIVVRHQKGLSGGFAGFFQRPFVEIEARPGTSRVDRYDAAEPALPAALVQPSLGGLAPAQPTSAAQASDMLAALAAGGSRGAAPPDALARFADGLGEQAPAEQFREQAPAEGFHELTPASLLERIPAHNGSRGPIPVQANDPFAAALAEAEAAVVPLESLHHEPSPREPDHDGPAHHELSATAGRPSADTPAEQSVDTRPAHAAHTPAPRGRARARIEDSLLGFGVEEALVRELIETAGAHVLPLMPARTSLARAVHRTIAQRIPSTPPLPVGSATIALVGPGGSGKTACCAALLDAYRERSTLPAACATIVPGAARGELAALLSPQILEPTPVAAPQVAEALRNAREEGLLLLDLPALSPSDRASIRTCAALLEAIAPDRVILALPATLGYKPAAQLLEALRPLGASALAITHADETDQLGVAVQTACTFGLAPEYLLDRGRGRGGLIQIDPAYLADRLLP